MAGKEAQIRVKQAKDKTTEGGKPTFIVEVSASNKKGTRRRRARTKEEAKTMVREMKRTLERDGFDVKVFKSN